MELQETRLFKNWWLLFLKGMLIIIYGILIMMKMFPSILSLRIFIFITLFNGILILFGTFYYKKNNSHWVLWLTEGTIDFLLGVTLIILIFAHIIKPHIMYVFINQIIAIWALLHGIIHTISAYRIKKYIQAGHVAFYAGISVILLALLLFVKPIISTMADNLFMGGFSIIIGSLLCTISVILRKIYSD